MQRASANAITGWAAILLAPLLVPIGFLANLLPGGKTIDRTPDDVIGFMSDLISGSGGPWDWDEFASVTITDPELDAIRRRAIPAGPPNPDVATLQNLITEAQVLARQRGRRRRPLWVDFPIWLKVGKPTFRPSAAIFSEAGRRR